jgi:hypothetical protein
MGTYRYSFAGAPLSARYRPNAIGKDEWIGRAFYFAVEWSGRGHLGEK